MDKMMDEWLYEVTKYEPTEDEIEEMYQRWLAENYDYSLDVGDGYYWSAR